jgi:outer membrane cobalamin receptor
VLWEGVSLNDPFGGWVSWFLLSRGEVGRVEVLPGGASEVWGGSALAGVVQVLEPCGSRL